MTEIKRSSGIALIVKSQPWSEIAVYYRDLAENYGWDMMPMVHLVEVIGASRYAYGIYAITSMATLCISQHSEFEFGENMLRVNYTKGRFVFRYMESPYVRKEWTKECGADEGFATFEHVMNRLRWFLE